MTFSNHAAKKSPVWALIAKTRDLKKPALASATAITILLTAFSTGAGAVDQNAGENFAKDNCARCHAIDKISASPYHKALPFRVIAYKYELAFLQEALAEGIETGHNVMPEFILTPKQIDDLLAYLQTLK